MGETIQFPVENASWHEAIEFCQKLGALAAEKKLKHTYRLPTEAEWEYAARGGVRDSKAFCYGDKLTSEMAHIGLFATTTTVGSYKPNAWGLFNMHGNVREWCSDWHAADWYKESPKNDPTGPTKGTKRVVRGGSYESVAFACRSAHRNGMDPDSRNRDTGFRVILVVER